jgi:hypothetical protein
MHQKYVGDSLGTGHIGWANIGEAVDATAITAILIPAGIASVNGTLGTLTMAKFVWHIFCCVLL